jgi:voltage-gated sodium channel
MHHAVENLPGWRGDIERFMALSFVQNFLIVLIVVNAIILGVETNREVMAAIGPELLLVDHVILWIFIAELTLLIAARRLQFFKDAWCVFDFLVVIIAFVPATGSLSVLRALRVLRVLRLINKVESMRTVVGALLSALPGLGSVFSLILIIFYVSAVIATNMFGHDFPERFGSLSTSLYTLFQVMTLEGWSEEIARPIMEVFPSSWVFFILFILTSTFIVVNLFVAVIVDSINSVRSAENAGAGLALDDEIRNLRSEVAELKSLVKDIHKKTGHS